MFDGMNNDLRIVLPSSMVSVLDESGEPIIATSSDFALHVESSLIREVPGGGLEIGPLGVYLTGPEGSGKAMLAARRIINGEPADGTLSAVLPRAHRSRTQS